LLPKTEAQQQQQQQSNSDLRTFTFDQFGFSITLPGNWEKVSSPSPDDTEVAFFADQADRYNTQATLDILATNPTGLENNKQSLSRELEMAVSAIRAGGLEVGVAHESECETFSGPQGLVCTMLIVINNEGKPDAILFAITLINRYAITLIFQDDTKEALEKAPIVGGIILSLDEIPILVTQQGQR
jgi:hypothetical protein